MTGAIWDQARTIDFIGVVSKVIGVVDKVKRMVATFIGVVPKVKRIKSSFSQVY